MANPREESVVAVSRLCPACGLCCNGVLFADVELQRGDDAKEMAGQGLAVRQKGHKQVLQQPCSCYDGRLCTIYSDRPQRCRTFECGLLKRVLAGESAIPAALGVIARARRQARAVDRLLRTLGNRDETKPLSERYGAVMSEPIDLSEVQRSSQRGRLMLAMHRLMETLQRQFLRAHGG